MKKRKKDPTREDRIQNQAIVDAYGSEERAMGWYYYLENQSRFPFEARCTFPRLFRRSGKVKPPRSYAWPRKHVCEHDMLVQIRWQGRKMAVPLSQLAAIDPDESTKEAIGDWHYWVSQGCVSLRLMSKRGHYGKAPTSIKTFMDRC